jgi:hypothetical protein
MVEKKVWSQNNILAIEWNNSEEDDFFGFFSISGATKVLKRDTHQLFSIFP